MGRVYAFVCPHCQYHANVSGGEEEGFHCTTQTIVCLDCKSLHDVAIKVRVAETPPAKPGKLLPSGESFQPPMLLFSRPPRTKWLKQPPRCPVFASHRVQPWTTPGKCPRCGIFLERAALPFRVWD